MTEVTPPRVLVVEDDDAVRLGLDAALAASGYLTTSCVDGNDIEAVLDQFRPDIAVLDVRLGSGPDGFTIGRFLAGTHGVPVIYLTAADAVEDRLRGFATGAEDYIVKPFAIAELLARLRVVLRRTDRAMSPVYEVRDLLIDERNRVARRGGVDLELTPTEFDLLAVLTRNADRVLTKVQLLSLVWGFTRYDPNLVEVHMSALRRKLEAQGPRIIHTARGAGYVLRR
jgi:DNA-binding response OmpR family regulator